MLGEADDLGERFYLFAVAGDGVEEEVGRAGRHELVELLAHFIRSSEDAELIGAGRIVVHVAEPLRDLRSGGTAFLVLGQ